MSLSLRNSKPHLSQSFFSYSFPLSPTQTPTQSLSLSLSLAIVAISLTELCGICLCLETRV